MGPGLVLEFRRCMHLTILAVASNFLLDALCGRIQSVSVAPFKEFWDKLDLVPLAPARSVVRQPAAAAGVS